MVSTVLTTCVKQRDADHSVVIAVAFQGVFESGTGDTPTTEPFGRGVAFPFIQAIKAVNDRLQERNPSEAVLFDVILISTTDNEEQQTRILFSLKHYGLEIGRLCFCTTEDFLEGLQSNNVKLFLSTDSVDVFKALQGGIAGAQLVQQTMSHSSEQLRVGFYGNSDDFPDDCSADLNPPAYLKDAQETLREFCALMGRMRGKFGVDDSPLTTSLITEVGSRDMCLRTLKTLRSWGLAVDEAHCLAGAPRGPIISLVKPHLIVILSHQPIHGF